MRFNLKSNTLFEDQGFRALLGRHKCGRLLNKRTPRPLPTAPFFLLKLISLFLGRPVPI